MSSLAKASCCAVVFVCFFLCADRATATTVIVPSDEELINGARAIVIAEVVAVSAALDDASATPLTYIELNVEESLKGDVHPGTLVLKEQGGEVDGRGLLVHGTPQFRIGERVLIYLDVWPDGSPRVYGMFLGKFSFEADAATGQTLLTRGGAQSGALVVGRSNAATDAMEAGAYLRMVRTALQAAREQPSASTLYGRRPLLQQPPEYQAKRGSGQMRLQFTTTAVATRWFEADSGQPVVFVANPSGAIYPQVQDDVRAALDAWSNALGGQVRLTAGVADQCAPVSGRVLITFNNCDGQWSPQPSCASVLAQTRAWYYPNISREVGGRTFYKTLQALVSFNPYASCHFTSHCNVQEILTHEIGHALGLGHSNVSSSGEVTEDAMEATMCSVAHFDKRCAALASDDVAGIRAIYFGTGPADGIIITTGTPLASYLLGSPGDQVFRAVGGTGPYTWELITAGGPPPGLSVRGTGEFAGTADAQGSYAFSVRVTDAAGHVSVKTVSLDVTTGPRIINARYKIAKGMLMVQGERFDIAGRLLLDGQPLILTSSSSDNYTVKRLPLASGQHQIRAVNAQGEPSDIFPLKVP